MKIIGSDRMVPLLKTAKRNLIGSKPRPIKPAPKRDSGRQPR